MSERITEFLARYDACQRRSGTPPAAWLDEAAALLRTIPMSDASPMARDGFEAHLTVLVAKALEAGLDHDKVAEDLENVAASLRE